MKQYLGDGVYANFNGFNIWLHANDNYHPSDKIRIEDDMLKNLLEFIGNQTKI